MGEIDLKHTLSNALPSGYSRQRPHTFALQQPNGGVYLFQAGSAEQVMEWVSACNYWAARESKEPLTGGVSNMEYGWGSCLDGVQEDDARPQNFPPVTIHDWQPPVPPTVSSALEEAAQLASLHKHVKELNEELDTHRDLKHKMEIRVSVNAYFLAIICMASKIIYRLVCWTIQSKCSGYGQLGEEVPVLVT